MNINDLNETQKRGLLKVIKLYLTLNITLYSLDDFAGTRFYVKEHRQQVNRTKELIERNTSTVIKDLFEADDAEVQKALSQYERIAELIASLQLDDLESIIDGLEQYKKEKDLVSTTWNNYLILFA